MTPTDRRALLLYLCVALSLAFVDHRIRRDAFRDHVVTEYIPSVIEGTSGAPAKYRVLMPYALDAAARATGQDPYLVFLWSELLFIAASLVMVHVYLRLWFTAGASIAGTLALAALLPLTFPNTWAHPDSFPDLFLFTAGCYAVAARRDGLLAGILIVGMFNRETMGFLLVLRLLDRPPGWRRPAAALPLVILGVTVVAVYVGLRWARGFEHYEMWMVPRNVEYMKVLPAGFDPYTRVAGFFWVVLLVPAAWFAWTAMRQPGAPSFFRSAAMVGALFVVVAWLFAAIIETRVFMPALPLLLPAAVGAFAPVGRGKLSPRADTA